jgi:hypothetical protein
MKRYPEDSLEYLQASIEAAKERRSAEAMARIKRRRSVDRARETLERIAPLIHQFEMEQHLRDHRDRKKQIHAKAKQIVRQHEASKGKRPDLVYKTRMKKDSDNA